MKDYIKYELGYKYEGNLYWMNNNNKKNLRTVFIWKK
jgi:hypothetical protein